MPCSSCGQRDRITRAIIEAARRMSGAGRKTEGRPKEGPGVKTERLRTLRPVERDPRRR